MLKQLHIANYTVVDQLDIDLEGGMTVLTGETGAGKSIMLDALGLCIGDRADPKAIRPGSKRAEITATFSLEDAPEALQWLLTRELEAVDDDCILRRVVSQEGRSRVYINGSPATLAQAAELGALLVDIHSQHAHQSLLRKSTQRALLDAFAGVTDLSLRVAEIAREWRQLNERLQSLSNQNDAAAARRDLLRYQVAELEELALGSNEIESLEAEQRALGNVGFVLESASAAIENCEASGDHLRRVLAEMGDQRHDSESVTNIRELINSADIQLSEAHQEISRYAESVDYEPERLREIESRLEAIYDMARKHRVLPEQLAERHVELEHELSGLGGDEEEVERLSDELLALSGRYKTDSAALSRARHEAAQELADRTMAVLEDLAMGGCSIELLLSPLDVGAHDPRGIEDIDFLVATNPGSAPAPLSKVASGGELSRLSLALQVVAADNATSPTMIFDEVDVGIGGGVAEIVGDLLCRLAGRVQVLCVTHLPQVAAKGHHHLRVRKIGNKTEVSTQLEVITDRERIDEIARMLGGVKITASTVAHAQEMLESA
ncbi:DNA repair protein RecN [Luminiphilus syltensis NOR5-1B]|uniref:DNA repair protein RecN n=1 Tax=Luminiphilus syltensis NOR5-1B TaxID=565045 RepID=B8KWU3_9GAMM|nr:DNA repair protein RecN [Luminiphilus syltensis]EED34273.1 DNA repair protein RecN [Luminiphilus syltensis NOR5-1B]